MHNQFTLTFLERLLGQKLPVLLHEVSGTSDRTWRTRLAHGWNPKDDELKLLQDRVTAALTNKMVAVGGWSADEAREIYAECPSVKFDMHLPIADFVYQFSPRYGEYCRETIALAIHFDRYCESLAKAVHFGEVDKAREVLLTMLNWLRTFCPEDSEDADAQALQCELETGADIEILLDAAKPLLEAMFLHVLSCWDIEFCAGYFQGTMQAYPLFQIVMPRFAPDIEIEPETGRLLRDGRQPGRGVFESATSRLFDFLSVLIAWQRQRRLPDSLPRVKELAAWSSQHETRLTSWRDETTRFTARQFDHLWTTALAPNSEGIYPAAPSPMFVCAHLWGPLLRRENGRVTELTDCTANYRLWWERNRDRIVARGVRFGEQAWPNYLTGNGTDDAALASVFSAQLAGRSVKPRDCQ